MQWDKGEDGHHRPETARIYCESCGSGWSEGDRLNALSTARWHQTKPFTCCGVRQTPLDLYERAWRADDANAVEEVWDWHTDGAGGRYAVYRAKCSECRAWALPNAHAGFQASKLYSPWQKDRPRDIAAKYLAAKGDPDREQAWWNTQIGLPHRPNTSKVLPIEALAARCEVWPGEVPDGVAVLTCGVDVQDYRVEIEVAGWGVNEESWSVDFHVIEGEFSDPLTQAMLDAYLQRIWRRDDGRGFEIVSACIDSGGHHTQAVYDFAKARLGRRVWAIKGESARSGQRSPVWPTKRPTSRNKKAFRPVILGVNAAKDTIRARLHLEKPGPGYMHFPVDRDINYFAQLTAERAVVKTVAGVRFRVWELPPGKANEALDCRVYAYAALCGALHFGLQLNRKAAVMARPPAPEEIVPIAQDEPDELKAWTPEHVIRVAPGATPPAGAIAAPPRRAVVSRIA